MIGRTFAAYLFSSTVPLLDLIVISVKSSESNPWVNPDARPAHTIQTMTNDTSRAKEEPLDSSVNFRRLYVGSLFNRLLLDVPIIS